MSLIARLFGINTIKPTAGPTVGIVFENQQATKLRLWIEPYCIEVELELGMEYRVESDATEYQLVFEDTTVILYWKYRFGPKVFKRPIAADFRNPEAWELIEDYSNI